MTRQQLSTAKLHRLATPQSHTLSTSHAIITNAEIVTNTRTKTRMKSKWLITPLCLHTHLTASRVNYSHSAAAQRTDSHFALHQTLLAHTSTTQITYRTHPHQYLSSQQSRQKSPRPLSLGDSAAPPNQRGRPAVRADSNTPLNPHWLRPARVDSESPHVKHLPHHKHCNFALSCNTQYMKRTQNARLRQ